MPEFEFHTHFFYAYSDMQPWLQKTPILDYTCYPTVIIKIVAFDDQNWMVWKLKYVTLAIKVIIYRVEKECGWVQRYSKECLVWK